MWRTTFYIFTIPVTAVKVSSNNGQCDASNINDELKGLKHIIITFINMFGLDLRGTATQCMSHRADILANLSKQHPG